MVGWYTICYDSVLYAMVVNLVSRAVIQLTERS